MLPVRGQVVSLASPCQGVASVGDRLEIGYAWVVAPCRADSMSVLYAACEKGGAAGYVAAG